MQSHITRFVCVIAFIMLSGVATESSVLAASADDERQHPMALTESGVVIGSTINGVNEFLGIPYAAPPVGPRRWRPPDPYGFFPGFFLRARP